MIYFGKKLMSGRGAENPRSAMLLYNVYQSLVNGFMAGWLVLGAHRAGFTLWGNREDRTAAGYDIAFGLWMHYNNKYLELFDTFFMVIKKKDDQISFLHVRTLNLTPQHSTRSMLCGGTRDSDAMRLCAVCAVALEVALSKMRVVSACSIAPLTASGSSSAVAVWSGQVYHHILLVWSWFVVMLFCVGGDAYFGSAFNSLVHFLMYGYYALALFAIPCPWKKHLTMFQMLQFVCCATQSLYCFYAGNLWWFIPALQLFVMLNMLVLFSRFYVKKYNKKPLSVASKAASSIIGFELDSARSSAASPPPTFSTALIGEASSPSPPPSRSPSPSPVPQEQGEDEDQQPAAAAAKKPSVKKRSKKAE